MTATPKRATLPAYTSVVLLGLIVSTGLFSGCKTEEVQTTRNKLAMSRWTKPTRIPLPSGNDPRSKKIRTQVYWKNLTNLIDSMYTIELDDQGSTPKTLIDVGGLVCGEVANEINSLPAEGVDEEAILAGQSIYATLYRAKDYYTEYGGTIDAFAKDPGAISDPVQGATAGMSAQADEEARERDAHIAMARARALLESRYEGVEFRMPHKLD